MPWMLMLWIRSMFLLLPLLIFCQEHTKGMSQHSTLFFFFPKVIQFFQTKRCFYCPVPMESWVMREDWGEFWSSVARGMLALPIPTAVSPEFTCDCCGHAETYISSNNLYVKWVWSDFYYCFSMPSVDFRHSHSHNVCFCHDKLL